MPMGSLCPAVCKSRPAAPSSSTASAPGASSGPSRSNELVALRARSKATSGFIRRQVLECEGWEPRGIGIHLSARNLELCPALRCELHQQCGRNELWFRLVLDAV